jgi:hypothetical protein
VKSEARCGLWTDSRQLPQFVDETHDRLSRDSRSSL